MTLIEQNGLLEWMLPDGRLVDPMKPGAIGLCSVLECLAPVGRDGVFCPHCGHGNT